jgi:uncharacterized cysteine cluster protein YcgN (CxxCxxCC family)
VNWLKAVQESTTTSDLLNVVNDYILDKPQDHWDWIPQSSHPRLVASAQEMHAWHHQVTTDLAKTDAPNIRMQDLAVLLLRASARAYEIAHEEGRQSAAASPFGDEGAAATRRVRG